MKTIRKIEIVPVFVDYIPEKLEEGKVYISREFELAVHNCLCGCKSLTVMPLTKEGWALTENEGKITLTPSIGNYEFRCKSHYIITNNIANFV